MAVEDFKTDGATAEGMLWTDAVAAEDCRRDGKNAEDCRADVVTEEDIRTDEVSAEHCGTNTVTAEDCQIDTVTAKDGRTDAKIYIKVGQISHFMLRTSGKRHKDCRGLKDRCSVLKAL